MRNKLLTGMLLLSAFWMSSCNSSTDKDGKLPANLVETPRDKNGNIDKSRLAEISFETSKHDFGKITEGEVVTYNFKFTNTGKGPLVISHATAACGCTVPKFSEKPVEPGESGFLEVRFDSHNKGGMTEKQVDILSNTIPDQHEIIITADIQPASK